MLVSQPARHHPRVRIVKQKDAVDAGKLPIAVGNFLRRARRVIKMFWFCGALAEHRALLTMNGVLTQEKRSLGPRWLRIAQRLVLLVALGLAIGWTLNRIDLAFQRRPEPAGFMRGLAQGALMPMALPNLAFGKDVIIYSANNTGRTYKLGYTIGVNTCGLIFFGIFFWRIRRLRARGGL